MNSKRRALVAVAGIIALGLLLTAVLRRPQQEVAREAPPVRKQVALAPPPAAPAVEAPAPEPEVVEAAPAPVEVVEDAPAEEVVSDEDIVEPINWYNGRDPETQPRTYFDQSFSNLTSTPDGFTVVGEEMRLSGLGWTLAPATAGDETRPRSAMVESPVLPLEFPSNAMNPMWREDSPAGTEVLVELALSPDGKNWTDWFPTTGGHLPQEIPPTYPDGTPNPNYGYQQGDMVFWGLKQHKFFKYAITLYSETGAAPTVTDFRMFYQDSTMGEGAIAEVGSGGSANPAPGDGET